MQTQKKVVPAQKEAIVAGHCISSLPRESALANLTLHCYELNTFWVHPRRYKKKQRTGLPPETK